MSNARLILIGRISLSILCALCGLIALGAGIWLIYIGKGASPEDGEILMTIPAIEIEVRPSTLGGYILGTSIVWGLIAFASRPQYYREETYDGSIYQVKGD